MAAILQDVPSVYENDQFRPLVELGEELSGPPLRHPTRSTTRALRVLADHGRAMTFLIADGVVPSNEDRGYILRRIMRRAIQQGRSIGLESPFLGRFADLVIEMMGDAYPELRAERDAIHQWLAAEEESFGRTLEQGTRLLAELVERAKARGHLVDRRRGRLPAARHLRLPVRPHRELLHEEGLSVDDAGFHELMEEQRERARTGTATRARHRGRARRGGRVRAGRGLPDALRRLRDDRGATRASARCKRDATACCLTKFPESPFYAEGGGQVADSGIVESESGRRPRRGRLPARRRPGGGGRGRAAAS